MKSMLFHRMTPRLAILGWLAATCASAQISITRQFTVNHDVGDFPGQYEDVQNISLGSLPISNLSVRIDISGRSPFEPGYNGDLYGTLTHDGAFAVLLNRAGKGTGGGLKNEFGYPDNGFNVTLSDSASQNIHQYGEGAFSLNASGQLTGLWQPDGRNVNPLLVTGTDPATANLSAFSGKTAEGEWTFLLRDFSAGGVHTLQSWGLSYELKSAASLGIGPGVIQTSGNVDWGSQGIYLWEINEAGGGKDAPDLGGLNPGWDHWQIDGQLNISATADDRFILQVGSLQLDNTPGPAGGFDATESYFWKILSASGGITGFGADKFTIDTSGFLNESSGIFALDQGGSDLFLAYTPIPEPALWKLAAIFFLGATWCKRPWKN
jgi:hypothetical protein